MRASFFFLFIMIITAFIPFYKLLSLVSSTDLLKLILVYSDEHHAKNLSQLEQNSNRIAYTAALIELFSRIESEHDIKCQTKQLLIGIKLPHLFPRYLDTLIGKLEKATLPLSPWSNWLHKVNVRKNLASIQKINGESFYAAADLTQKYITERVSSFSVWRRKKSFFYNHTGNYWETPHHVEQREVEILTPYFNKEEIERVKEMAIALCFPLYFCNPLAQKGLYFLISIFYKLTEVQGLEVKQMVLILVKASSHTRIFEYDMFLDPLYELLVLLAPTFNDSEVAFVVEFFLRSVIRYYCRANSSNRLAIELVKILLDKMEQEQIQSIYTQALIYVKSDKEHRYILSLLVSYLKKPSQIQTLKSLEFTAWRDLGYETVEFLTQIVPHCTEAERTKINFFLPTLSNQHHHALRLAYVLSFNTREELTEGLIDTINYFDWDFTQTDLLMFNDLLSTFTDKQISQIMRQMLSTYEETINTRRRAPAYTRYTMAKDQAFRIISHRLTAEQVNYAVNALMLCKDKLPTVQMQLQALNIMCLLILSQHTIHEHEHGPKTLTSGLLQPFFHFYSSKKSTLSEVGIKTQTVLRQLSAYIQRIEEPKVDYPSKRHSDNEEKIDFRYGFWVASKNRAENRESNYKLARALQTKVYENLNEDLETIFNEDSILAMQDQIQQPPWRIGSSLRTIIIHANTPVGWAVRPNNYNPF
ncbi:hypothetical protein N9Q05_01300 [bacterium]|nr:hypothetical protein [bacterium]